MLSIKNINVSIGSVNVLRSISMEVENQKLIGLIGRNGSGKTTLMRTIIGLLPHQGGLIMFNGKPLDHSIPAYKRVRMGIGYMPEDRRLVPELTVKENILITGWTTRKDEEVIKKLDAIYDMIPEVQELSKRKALFLSGGQQKLVALARALMAGDRILLLDEPFEGVAPVLAKRLIEVIRNLKNVGISIILTESDLTHSKELLDSICMIDRGEIIPPKQL